MDTMGSDKIRVRFRNSAQSLKDQAGHQNQLKVYKKQNKKPDPLLEPLNPKHQNWEQRALISQKLPSDLSDLGSTISDLSYQLLPVSLEDARGRSLRSPTTRSLCTCGGDQARAGGKVGPSAESCCRLGWRREVGSSGQPTCRKRRMLCATVHVWERAQRLDPEAHLFKHVKREGWVTSKCLLNPCAFSHFQSMATICVPTFEISCSGFTGKRLTGIPCLGTTVLPSLLRTVAGETFHMYNVFMVLLC